MNAERKILLLAVLLFAGCKDCLTNQEIVEQSEYCTRNGLDTRHYSQGIAGCTTRIQCGSLLKGLTDER